MTQIHMPGEELVKKILSGERNYRNVVLEDNFNLAGHDGYQGMLIYLRKQDMEKNRYDFSKARLAGLKAPELYLPFVIALEANLESADLRSANLRAAGLGSANLGGADLRYASLGSADLGNASLGSADLGNADLRAADLGGADLRYASLGGANLWSANLRYAKLRGASLGRADLMGASLGRADLRGTRNLELALNLEHAIYGGTTVTEKERTIIEKVRGEARLFDVRE